MAGWAPGVVRRVESLQWFRPKFHCWSSRLCPWTGKSNYTSNYGATYKITTPPNRFLVIADPCKGQQCMTYRKMKAPLLVIWLLGTLISVVPAIYYRSSSKFYGIYSGTCFPLHLEDLYPVGWLYSAFLFFGVNLVLLLAMVALYSGLLYSIRKTSRATPLNFKDCEITIRFFFIVLTSASCWASIIGCKFLAALGYEFGREWMSMGFFGNCSVRI